MAQTALQALKQQRRQLAREARRIKATKLIAEQQRPWWAPLVPPAEASKQKASDVDCHQILGAKRGASPKELKEAFLAKAQQHHPLSPAIQDNGRRILWSPACATSIWLRHSERRRARELRQTLPG
ncbi:unnamed protein product [Effrenium voratum]|nr:unnamed protein product [Effrenium voratum]